jgi:hypothetical protein
VAVRNEDRGIVRPLTTTRHPKQSQKDSKSEPVLLGFRRDCRCSARYSIVRHDICTSRPH